MKYGFDLDGTLDRPVIAELARALHAAGHEIHIITASPFGNPKHSKNAKETKLAALRVPYHQLHIASGTFIDEMAKKKADFVQLNHIDFFIDDMFDFCLEVQKLNPIPVCHLWAH